MRKIFIITLVGLLTLGLTLPFVSVKALEVVQTQGSYQLTEDKTVSDEMIATANRIDIKGNLASDSVLASDTIYITGTAEKDITAAARLLSVSGTVNQDALLAGAEINVSGTIKDDLRLAGGQVDLNGQVNGSVLAAGGALRFGAESTIARNLIFAGGTFVYAGQVDGDLYGVAGTVEIAGEINGDVHIYTGKVIVRSSAIIAGDFIYHSNREATIEDGAQIGGITERRIPLAPVILGLSGLLALLVGFIISVLGFFIVGILYVRIFAKFVRQAENEIKTSRWQVFWKGLLVLLLTPTLSLLLMFTIIGIPLAGIMLIVWGLSLFISQIMFAMYIGDLLLRKKNMERGQNILALFLGLALTQAIFLIPRVGLIFRLIAIILGLGMAWLAWRKNTTADFSLTNKAKTIERSAKDNK